MHGNINGPSRTSGMTRAGLGIVVITLLADLTVAAIKFAKAYILAVTAMSSEGVHWLVDAGTEVIVLYGLIASGERPAPSTSSAMVAESTSATLWLRC